MHVGERQVEKRVGVERWEIQRKTGGEIPRRKLTCDQVLQVAVVGAEVQVSVPQVG